MSTRRIGPVLHAVTDSISTVLMRGQLAYLKAHGFDPALVSNPGRELDRIGAEEGYPVFAVPMKREISPLSDLRSLFALWSLLRRHRPAICNAGTPKAGLLVGLAAWITRVPCRVYTLRGLRLETASGLKKLILTIAERVSCFTAHRVICVSASLRERAISLGLVARRKTVLLGFGSSNGVDADRFEPTPERIALAGSIRQNLNIRPEQPVIGFAGRITRDKGLPELIAAFQRIRNEIPDAILLLVGDYEEGDPVPQEIRDAIELNSAIHRIGFTSQIERYYHAMNLFVLPTHREGFPNTILEAQAAGLPVVATAVTGAVDAIVDGITGLLTPVSDADTLARSVLSLLTDPMRMQTMGRMGRERVLREYRNEMVWEALVSLYRTMLQEHGYPVPLDSSVEGVRCAQTQ